VTPEDQPNFECKDCKNEVAHCFICKKEGTIFPSRKQQAQEQESAKGDEDEGEEGKDDEEFKLAPNPLV